MSAALLATFAHADALVDAARRARRSGFTVIDAYTPFPLEELNEVLALKPSRVRIAMACAGFGMAAALYLLQWWSAVIDYPINSGGRPLHSWPVFPLICFEVGVLAAAAAGLVFLLLRCGLPRLHHPIFDAPHFDRASQDRFVLAVAADPAREAELRAMLNQAGASVSREVAS